MLYGWAGNNLRIDLSQGNIEKEEGDFKLNEAYLGGRGTCTKLFWDQVAPEVSPLSSGNPMIFGTGVLCGTSAPGANRTILVTRSPQTNLLTYSLMGGFWAPELKHAGYDNLSIFGKSPLPVYIFIKDDIVEIRDASHLWGKDILETQKIIRDELKNDKLQTLAIGPAGENKVYCSSIEHSTGASLSRAGVGAVMGDKKLKAIAVYGTKDINIAKPAEFNELCGKIHKKSDRLRTFVDNWSYERAGLLEKVVYGNSDEFSPMENVGAFHEEFLKKHRTRQISCYNCALRCKHAILLDGHYSYVKCVSWYSFIAASKIRDLDFAIRCYQLCEKYGFDSLSLAYLIAYAIDIYEKGILTKKDTGGMHLEYGNPDVFLTMIEQIAHRKGIGDVLANGIYKAARQIGNGAEEFAIHTKKLEITIYPLQNPYINIVQCLSDRADMLKLLTAVPQHYTQKTKEEKEDYINSEYWLYPEEYKDLIWENPDPKGGDYARLTTFTSYDDMLIAIADITGLCRFWTGFWPFNPYIVEDIIKLVSYSTGLNIDEDELLKVAKRTVLLTRAYNVRLGIRRKDDSPPEKYFYETTKPPIQLGPIDRDIFNKTVDSYYKLKGYNKDGIPTKQALDEVGLDYVREDLVQRRILADEENKKNRD